MLDNRRAAVARMLEAVVLRLLGTVPPTQVLKDLSHHLKFLVLF